MATKKASSKYAAALKLSDEQKKEVTNEFVIDSAKNDLEGQIINQKKAISDGYRERAEMLQKAGLKFSELSALDENIAARETGLTVLEGYLTELF